jgi:two-component system CitB family sensor kinase
MRRESKRKLSNQIFASQLAILVATVLAGFILFAHQDRAQLDQQYEDRAAAIAQTTAGVPDIVSCLQDLQVVCDRNIQSIASRIQLETGAAYVVVIDMQRIRHSHPDPALIGQQVAEPIVTADGRTHVGINNGSTGRSANGKAPIYGSSKQMLGEVSVGIRESSVSQALWSELPSYAGWFAIALAGGALASWLLARRLKRRTFGLELDEIAQLLQEREATLHAIREGVVAFDRAGRVTMVNDEARRLLELNSGVIGGTLDSLVAPGRLRDVLSGQISGQDEVVLTDDYCLTVNRMPVSLMGTAHGAVVTLRDRTEMAGLLRELDSVRTLTDSLRAQQHEFTNRLHTLAGLLELGQVDEALHFLTELRVSEADFGEHLRSRIASPLVVGLILGKAAAASERGIRLTVSEDTRLGSTPPKVQALTTILGNLIDNAFEALSGLAGTGTGWVAVSLVEDDEGIFLSVADNGPGIPPGTAQSVFLDGFTTKPQRGSLRRGLGLALVHRLVRRVGGSITVEEGPGAVFTVRLPRGPLADAAPAPAPVASNSI